MGEVVNKIVITQTTVSAGREEGIYNIEAYWQLNGGTGCSYKGSYTVLLLENGEEKSTFAFQDTGGIHYLEQEVKDLDKEQRYSIILRAEQGSSPVASQENMLLLHTFENLRGSFDGEEFTVSWDKTDSSIAKGELTLWSEKGITYTCEVPVYTNFVRIPGIRLFPLDRAWISMEGNDAVNAFGPESGRLEFYADACEVLSVDHCQKEDRTDVDVCLSPWQSVEDGESSDQVQFVFCGQGRESLCIADVPVQKSGQIFRAKVSVPYTALRKDKVFRCELFCYRQKGAAVSRIRSVRNHICMSVPKFNIVHRDAEKVGLEWTYCGEYEPDYFVDGNGTKIYDKQCTVEYENAENFSLAAGFDIDGKAVRGSFAGPTGIFQEGYYPVLQEDGALALAYHQDSMSEESVTREFSGRLFQTEPEFPVVFGGISLEKKEDSYLLGVCVTEALSIEDHKAFLKKICDFATPYGFYLLTECLARMSCQRLADMPCVFFGYDGKNRMCDLRPGNILEVQTELYMPQENPDIDHGAGFVTVFREEYIVSFPADEDGKFLEFNSFADGFADAMNVSSLPDEDNVVFAGGLRDFLCPKARQPFYRIMYPAELADSSVPENGYPSDNVILLAADTYGGVAEAAEAVLSDPSSVNHLNIPVVMFRGRNTMTASINVTVNKETRKVPVGTTLGKLLQRLGIYCRKDSVPDTLRIYRRSPDGKEVPVYTDWIKCPAEKLVMVSGDRIEV